MVHSVASVFLFRALLCNDCGASEIMSVPGPDNDTKEVTMAQKVQVTLVDDIDGSQADETVSFSLDGVSYEIDLTAARAQELRDALAPWQGHARRAGGRKQSGRRSRSGGSSSSSEAGKIREWAKEHGYNVSERGRISAEIREAYEKAS